MSIEKEGNHYVAEGDGLRAEGKTHLQAIMNLIREIVDMRSFYHSFDVEYHA